MENNKKNGGGGGCGRAVRPTYPFCVLRSTWIHLVSGQAYFPFGKELRHCGNTRFVSASFHA